MKTNRSILCLAPAFTLLLAGPAALAESGKMPNVEMKSTGVALGLTASGGKGVLHLPNLATGCRYRFTFSSAGIGLAIGIRTMVAHGAVTNLAKVADFPGGYASEGAEATLGSGKGTFKLRNQRNTVAMALKSKTEGVSLGAASSGVNIKLKDPIPDRARVYVMYFGFNKSHVNKASRATLDKMLAGWKCRYANFTVSGNTDTVGKEDYNLKLSAKRAEGVMAYLLKAGVNPARIATRALGKSETLMSTAQGVRLRSNRAVVLIVK